MVLIQLYIYIYRYLDIKDVTDTYLCIRYLGVTDSKHTCTVRYLSITYKHM